jgi:hypothetical protein
MSTWKKIIGTQETEFSLGFTGPKLKSDAGNLKVTDTGDNLVSITASGFVGSGAGLTSINGANVTGVTGNAAYANIAGVAYSVDGANVVGQVADAASADVALSVDLANVVGAGSVAAIDLNGSVGQYLNGAGEWVVVEQGDPAADTWLAEVSTDLGSPAFPVPAAFAGTIHEVADASALTSALTAAADGDVIKLTADITLASTLTVDKSVKFTGGFALQSDASTAAPVTLISVTAAAYFDETITIKHRKTNNTSVECAVNVNATDFVSDARVEFMEFGYIVRGSFSIGGSTAYTGALGNSHRHIAISKITAPSQVEGVQFEFPQESTARANLIFISSASGTDLWDSLLKVSNCSHDLSKYCRQFLFIETLATTGRTASLWASQNSFNALNGGIGMLASSTATPFDQFAAIVLYKNYEGTAAEGNYKGVMFVDGSGTLRSIGAPTILAVADNQGPSILRSDYTYAVASAIAIKNTVFTKPAALTPTFGQTILDSIGRGDTTINMAATSATVAVSGNVVVGITASGMAVTGVVSGTSFTGNGANLSSITGANVTGQVADAASADVALSVDVANVAGIGNIATLNLNGNSSTYLDGTGAWTEVPQPDPTKIINGTTDVTIGTAGGNVATTVGGTANVVVVSSGGMTVTGDFNITGNINATGNVNYQNVIDLVVGDPLIFLGANNAADTFDLGFSASYDNGAVVHTGFARDATDGVWKLFDGVATAPTTTVDFASGTLAAISVGSTTVTGDLTVSGKVVGELEGPLVGGLVTVSIDADQNEFLVDVDSTTVVQVDSTGINVTGLVSADNISVGTLEVLTSTNLGEDRNVRIGGGQVGQYLSTSVVGALEWLDLPIASKMDTAFIDFDATDGYQPTTVNLPAGSIVDNVIVFVDSAFDSSSTQVVVGLESNTDDYFVLAGDTLLTAVGRYEVPQSVPATSSADVLRVKISGAGSSGFGHVIVHFSTPVITG